MAPPDRNHLESPASYRSAPPVDAAALEAARVACGDAREEALFLRALGDWHLERAALAEALHAHEARIEALTKGTAREASSAVEMDVVAAIDEHRDALAGAHETADVPAMPGCDEGMPASPHLRDLRDAEAELRHLAASFAERAASLEAAAAAVSLRARDWWALTHGPALAPRPSRSSFARPSGAPPSPFPVRWVVATYAVLAEVVGIVASL